MNNGSFYLIAKDADDAEYQIGEITYHLESATNVRNTYFKEKKIFKIEIKTTEVSE